jgi:DNA-binding response OmpR family regulator
MRALLIEDDPELGEFLENHLPKQGFAVDRAAAGREGLRLAALHEYDIAILDFYLPDLTGEAVLVSLIRMLPCAPVLMLTVFAGASMKVRLLSLGADDYLEKPFSFDELVARMRALMRRSRDVIPNVLSTGDLRLNTQHRTVMAGGQRLELTPKEFGILEYLLQHQGQVVSKETLIEHIWNARSDPFSNAIQMHMANLRKKLLSYAVIRTVHGQGYVIDG